MFVFGEQPEARKKKLCDCVLSDICFNIFLQTKTNVGGKRDPN